MARVAEDFEGMQTHLNTILEFEPSNKRARQLDRWIIWRDNKDWIYKSTLVLGLLLTGIFLVGFIIRLMREG